MAEDVVLMPPHEPVLKGKAAVRTWYHQFLTHLRTSSLTIADREVLTGGEWATEIATFEWGLVPVGADRPSSIEAAMHRSGTMSQMDLAVRPRDREIRNRTTAPTTAAQEP